MNIIKRYIPSLESTELLKLKPGDIIEVQYINDIRDKKFHKYTVEKIINCNKKKHCSCYIEGCPYFGICINVREQLFSVTCISSNTRIKINGLLVKRRNDEYN